MLANVERFNILRGGLNPSATNVLYVHGQLDPWRSIGVQTNETNSPFILVIGLYTFIDVKRIRILLTNFDCRSFARQ